MLSVDAAKMHKVDTRNVENLFGMWTGEILLHSNHEASVLNVPTSLFKMCRLDGRWSTAREPKLADLESRDALLRITTTTDDNTCN